MIPQPENHLVVTKPSPRPFSRREAIITANALLRITGIGEVYTYGWLVQDQLHGADINILLVAEQTLYEKYRDILTKFARHEQWHDKSERYSQRIAVGQVCKTGVTLWSVLNRLEETLQRSDVIYGLNIHLMPRNWQHKLAQIQNELPLRDPNFMENVFKNAIQVAKKY